MSGGKFNHADGDYTSILGGYDNIADEEYETVLGGTANWAFEDTDSTDVADYADTRVTGPGI